jgi:hypothetical protein
MTVELSPGFLSQRSLTRTTMKLQSTQPETYTWGSTGLIAKVTRGLTQALTEFDQFYLRTQPKMYMEDTAKFPRS